MDKREIIEKFARTSADTGSSEVQVALITGRIEHISQHLSAHAKDHSSRRGLLKLVGQRKRLLRYLSNCDGERYHKLVESLGLRK